MSWLYRLQQRLSITKNEAMTLLALSLFLLLGSIGRHACRQMRPVSPEFYAEADSLFAERSAAVFGPLEGADRNEPLPASPSEHAADTRGDDDGTSADGVASFQTDVHAGATGSDGTRHGPAEATGSDGTRYARAGPTATRSLRIDLNRAGLHELDQLPRVGPRTAERIVAYRKTYGSFRSVDELIGVSGIGPKTLEQIRPHVYVAQDSTD